MSVLRAATIEATILGRNLRWWMLALVCVWVVLLRVQEPAFARRQGIQFFWAGVESTVLIATVLAPIASAANPWSVRLSLARRTAWIQSIAIQLYCVTIVLIVLAAAILSDSLAGSPVEWRSACLVGIHGFCVLLPVSTLAPALRRLARDPIHHGLAWIAVLICSLELGAPLPMISTSWSAEALGTTWLSAAFSILQATLAGFVLSWAVTDRPA